MAADFELDLLEEKPGTLWVSFVAKRPIGRGTESYAVSIEFEEATLSEMEDISDNDEDDRDLLLQKARDWKGFKTRDEDGKLIDAPFDRDRLKMLLNRLWFLRAASEAFQTRMASVERKRSRQRGN